MMEVAMERGDLFGALIIRKVDPESALYNGADLFGLSLPELDDVPRDIFVSHVKSVNSYHEYTSIGPNSQKETVAESVEICHDSNLHRFPLKYLSLVPKETRLPVPRSKSAILHQTESFVSSASLLAMRGTSSDLFMLDRQPPSTSITGRSVMSVQRFLAEVRSLFVMRTLLDCACSDFVNHSTDAAGFAVGSQLVELLHLFDASLAGLQAGRNGSGDSCPDEGAVSTSLAVLWERTQLHRMFLVHIFALVRPVGVDCEFADFGGFVLASTANGTDENHDILAQLVKPRSWVNRTGWSMFHNILGLFDLARSSTWSVHSVPMFEKCLFRNSADFALNHRSGEDRLGLDFGRMVLTGAVLRQVSAPLLRELKEKLFDLDAEFFTQDSAMPAELQSSLLISIDALWRSFTDSSPDRMVERGCTEETGSNGGSRRAEQCVEFLLGALAWARGRVQLLLLAPAVGVDLSDPGATTSLGLKTVSVAGRSKHKVGSLQVRDRVVDGGDAGAIGNGAAVRPDFNRQAVIDAFRAIRPELVLPLNNRDEERMAEIIDKSLALQSSMKVEIELKISEWYLSFATLSDYYNEHAVSIKTLFTKDDHRQARQAVSVRAQVLESRVSLARRKLDRRAAEEAAENTPATPDPSTQTFLAGPLNAPRTVPTTLVEAAKDHIRAKYVSLMKEVEAKGVAAAWSNKRHETLPLARTSLAGLFEQDTAELERLHALKQQDADSYQRHFDDELGVTPMSPLSLLPLEVSEMVEFAADRKNNSSRTDPVEEYAAEELPNSGAETLTSPASAVGTGVTTTSRPMYEDELLEWDAAVEETSQETVISHAPERSADEQSAGEEGTAATVEDDEAAPPSSPPPAVASHSLVDLAPFLLGKAANQTATSADVDATCSIQSLEQSILLLASAHGLVTCSADDLAAELSMLKMERPDASPAELHAALLRRVAQPVSSLHSLYAVLMRSLGRAVLAQCRAINLASLHCLINSSVDLLGHIQAVDNLLLVSPNSDFLVSLCTLMVDRHQQNIRLLRRQGGAPVESLSPQLRNPANATLWSNEALQTGFTSVLASASAANEWKAYGTLYASMNTATIPNAEEAVTAPDSVSAAAMHWSSGLFSSAPLASLAIRYDAPWPLPAIVTDKVLGKFTAITRRFLEVGQLVALFRIVWGELRNKRVVTSRSKPVSSAHPHPQQVDRLISDSMRLVQQTVQHLFDYLSERVYVHQARFKQAMRHASSHGLDAVVNALNVYSEGLADAALQFSAEEEAWLAGPTAPTEPALNPNSDDPSISLKRDINGMLECSRRVLHASKALCEASVVDSLAPNAIDALQVLKESSCQINEHRKLLIISAKRVAVGGKAKIDLQPLIMRFESSM